MRNDAAASPSLRKPWTPPSGTWAKSAPDVDHAPSARIVSSPDST